MEFNWTYQDETSALVRSFLKRQGISKKLLAKIKFQGGQILVNGTEQNVLFSLNAHDIVTVVIPDEAPHETLLADAIPLDIVFEDEHILLVNKPAGIASIPAQYHPRGTMANRVKAYYVEQGYPNQVVHVVTRLDRDTSGLMLFAKHGFAHSKLDQGLQQKQFIKKYQALVSGAIETLKEHAQIDLPIGRDLSSLIKRQVIETGQKAQTEYWLKKSKAPLALVDIQLHTGRTHQIRVHFSAIDCPLLGDELYGGAMDLGIQRQALHCYSLSFYHPFSGERLFFELPLASDMAQVAQLI
ncbi:RluA family pseudouridine synthase [Enterococcus hermanniensis]|uniref:Pseudouridine synthase n=1 Tax=Enterococcus hermanniensis TaxID=249189 RepID=A0A1L8TNZ1_9ENTE|nr:RluA family pseudouridine synthase [Enterococcus hermanniensis]OJG45997.1 RluA family pseudouridine synthase [Enterococcus hermanniensis]